MSQATQNSVTPPAKVHATLEQQWRVFAALGRRLNSAGTTRRAAELLAQAADELMGWDACSFDLYSPERDMVTCILSLDVLGGKRTEVTPPEAEAPPSERQRQVIAGGAQIILRDGAPKLDAEGNPFGDKRRPSASLLFVPLRCHRQVIGEFTIQRYTPYAYTREDLEVLQALADHGGGAMDRIQTAGLLRRTEELYRRAIGGAGAVPYVYDYRTHSYVFIGQDIEQLTGYTDREINGEVWAKIIQEAVMRGEAAGLDKNEAARRVQSGELRSWRCDMRIVTRDGRSRWLSDASVQNLDEAGRAIGSMGILEDITDRKEAEAELEQLHRRLLDVSRQAGMADVATSVLHNVGNVLNSVNVSSSLLFDKVRSSKLANFARAVALLDAHAADLPAFLTRDPKGKQLPGYLHNLAEHLAGEQKEMLKELESLSANIEHIKEIVAMQQSYATVCGVIETLPLAELIEDALRLNTGALQRHKVEVIREFAQVPPIPVDKHKVLQILVNLIRNAKYALDDRGHADKRMVLRLEATENKTLKVSVSDNGIGIAPENLTRIFEHGFTTRKDGQGHGFGLHNGALAAKDLGGSLHAHSDGLGHGATLVLELPCQPRPQAR